VNQRIDVAERTKVPAGSAGQRRAPEPRPRVPAGARAPAEARTPTGTRATAGARPAPEARTSGGTRTPARTRSAGSRSATSTSAQAAVRATARERARVPAGAAGAMPTRTRPAGVKPSRGGAGPGTGPARASRPARSGRGRTAPESRTRFFFLVVALLGGGLLCLLLVNTILATGAFKITALQQGNVALAQREQSLQAQVAAEEAPSALAKRARALGMVAPPLVHFLDLKTGRIISQPRRVAGLPTVTVPGYAP